MTSTESFTPAARTEIAEIHNGLQRISIETRLPDDSFMYRRLEELGVQGTPVAAIDAGEQRFAVVNVTGLQVRNGRRGGSLVYEPFDPGSHLSRNAAKLYELEESHPYILAHLSPRGLDARALRPGIPLRIGREYSGEGTGITFDYGNDTELSREHCSIELDASGSVVEVTDFASRNGTIIRYGTERYDQRSSARQSAARPAGKMAASAVKQAETQFATIPDYEHASVLESDELWAQPNNGGNPQDEQYVQVYRELRRRIVGDIESGRLYSNPEAFRGFLENYHKNIGRSGVYNRLNPDHGLFESEMGQFDRPGRRYNARLADSRKIAGIASRYGDSYGADDRLWRGPALGGSRSTVNLIGIDPDNLPFDIVRYDKKGNVLSTWDTPGYTFAYPSNRGIGEYMSMIQQLGKTIEHATREGGRDTDEILSQIGRQYQYGACARPFRNINNSLFMQIANAQVKLLGLPGMTHGVMDLAAQRMQPAAFARYFVDRARGREL